MNDYNLDDATVMWEFNEQPTRKIAKTFHLRLELFPRVILKRLLQQPQYNIGSS